MLVQKGRRIFLGVSQHVRNYSYEPTKLPGSRLREVTDGRSGIVKLSEVQLFDVLTGDGSL